MYYSPNPDLWEWPLPDPSPPATFRPLPPLPSESDQATLAGPLFVSFTNDDSSFVQPRQFHKYASHHMRHRHKVPAPSMPSVSCGSPAPPFFNFVAYVAQTSARAARPELWHVFSLMPTVEVDDWRRLCLTVRFLGVPWNVEINNPYDLEDEANNRSGPWDDSHQGAIDSWQDPNDGEQGAIDSWQDPNDGEQGAIDSWQDPNSLQGAVDSWQDLNEGEQIYNVGWEVHWEFAPGDEWWETKKVETCEGKDDASSFASVDSDDDGAGAGGARRRDWVFKVVYALLVVEDVEDEDVLGEDASDVILGALKYVLATPERYGTRMVEVFSMAVEERMVLTDEQRRLVGLPVKDPEERKGKGKEKDPEEYGGHGEEARTQPFVWIPGEDGQRYIFAERFTSWMYQPTTALRTSTQR